MLVIRLSRTGKRNSPSFRVVVQEKHRTPTGKAVEFLGYYNPRLKEKQLKTDRIKYWLEKGAQPSGSIHNLLVTEGILKASKVRVSRLHPKREETDSDKEVAPQEKEATSETAPKASEKEAKDSKKEEVAQQEPANKEVSSETKKSQSEAKKEKKDQPTTSPKDDRSAKS